MLDAYNRTITYMRVSLTDRCNLRCRYCMPAEGICKRSHHDMLTEEEMIRAIGAAASLGIRKLRFTGGEPLIKSNVLSLCQKASRVPGINEICMTTNGILLPSLAEDLKASGVSRLNISLDTLDAEKYSYMTRGGKLSEALSGIEAALSAGFDQIKLNAVLIGGFNEDEISSLAELTLKWPVDLRFIELMPMYDGGDFDASAYVPVSEVLRRLPSACEVPSTDSVARHYKLPGALGRIGLISPLSAHFCGDCNRIRLMADGRVKPCLHSGDELSLKGLTFTEMQAALTRAIQSKPLWHGPLTWEHRSRAGRNMNEIGG